MPSKIPRQELIEDLQRVDGLVEGTLTYSDYTTHGRRSMDAIQTEFGGIVAAREAAGVGDGAIHGVEVTEPVLLEDLQKTAEGIGRPPSWNEYDELGSYSSRLVAKKFSSFSEGRQRAGLDGGPERPQRIETKKLISDIQAANADVDGTVTESDIERDGEYALDTYVRRFGSWAEAVEAAGLEPNTMWNTGEDNGAWKGGVSHDYSSREWRNKRAEAIRRDCGRCQVCEMSIAEHIETYGREIDVHHIIRVDDFENAEDAHYLDNLITLCRKHHREYEELGAKGREKLRKLV